MLLLEGLLSLWRLIMGVSVSYVWRERGTDLTADVYVVNRPSEPVSDLKNLVFLQTLPGLSECECQKN